MPSFLSLPLQRRLVTNQSSSAQRTAVTVTSKLASSQHDPTSFVSLSLLTDLFSTRYVCQRNHGPSHGPFHDPTSAHAPVARLLIPAFLSNDHQHEGSSSPRLMHVPSHMFSAPTAITLTIERIDMFLELHNSHAARIAHLSKNTYRRPLLPAPSHSTLPSLDSVFLYPCTLPAATYLHSLTQIEVYVRCAFQRLDVGCTSAL